MSSAVGKLLKAAVVSAGAVAAGYGIKKAYENDFQDFKDFARKGKGLIDETFRAEKKTAGEDKSVDITDDEEVLEFVDEFGE
jgi:hypothetical protein